MPSLESYFKAQGKSFESYSAWLNEASPEELLSNGVRSGMLIILYGPDNVNNSSYVHKSIEHLCNQGFNLESSVFRCGNYVWNRNPALQLFTAYLFDLSMLITNTCESNLELATDLSQIVRGIIAFVEKEEIASLLLPSGLTEFEYKLTNYEMSKDGSRIFKKDTDKDITVSSNSKL